MSETPRATDGVADAARGLSDSTAVLVRHEIAAAQREMLGKARQALPAIGLLGAAGFFGVLSASASYRLSVRLLEKSLPPATAALVAAAGYGAAAGAAGTLGIQRLRGSQLVPVDTVRQAITTATGTVKAVAGTAAKTATDTAKAVTGSAAAKKATDTAKATATTAAKKATDTAKATAGTTAKKATETATTTAKKATDKAKAAADTGSTAAAATTRKAAGSTARAAGSRTRGKAATPDQPGTSSG